MRGVVLVNLGPKNVLTCGFTLTSCSEVSLSWRATRKMSCVPPLFFFWQEIRRWCGPFCLHGWGGWCDGSRMRRALFFIVTKACQSCMKAWQCITVMQCSLKKIPSTIETVSSEEFTPQCMCVCVCVSEYYGCEAWCTEWGIGAWWLTFWQMFGEILVVQSWTVSSRWVAGIKRLRTRSGPLLPLYWCNTCLRGKQPTLNEAAENHARLVFLQFLHIFGRCCRLWPAVNGFLGFFQWLKLTPMFTEHVCWGFADAGIASLSVFAFNNIHFHNNNNDETQLLNSN